MYQSRRPDELSWTQENPEISLQMIHALALPKDARIIDVGGGDSRLVDYLLAEGFEHISVLDIAAASLERARKRLGAKGDKVQWIVSDIRNFRPEGKFDLWHDRATFHFLINEEDIAHYRRITEMAVSEYLVLGTFSEHGPDKCSGLPVKKYSAKQMAETFEPNFQKINCLETEHLTPAQASQMFTFCSFRRVS